MDDIKIYDSELLLMEYLWENGPCLAVDLARVFLNKYNWKKSTTYIVLKRLEGKGAVQRDYPKYTVTPIITRQQVQSAETHTLVDKMFGGSFPDLFANFLKTDSLPEDTLDQVQAMIDQKRKEK